MNSTKNIFFSRYLAPGDTIRQVFHRHVLVILPNIFFWLVIPIGLVVWGVYRWFYPDILGTTYLWLFEGYVFVMFLYMIYKVLDWYCDVWVLTDRGIIDIRWSLFMNDYIFTEYHDVSAIEYSQGSLIDKIFSIGDVTIHKHGEATQISRMYMPAMIVEMVQKHLHVHHHVDTKPQSETHIYLDGMRQRHVAVPYKNGFRFVPSAEDDARFVDKVKKQPGTIDLTGSTPIVQSGEETPHDHGHH